MRVANARCHVVRTIAVRRAVSATALLQPGDQEEHTETWRPLASHPHDIHRDDHIRNPAVSKSHLLNKITLELNEIHVLSRAIVSVLRQ